MLKPVQHDKKKCVIPNLFRNLGFGNDSKEPRPQGGALKPQNFRTKNQIPKQVRDDKKESQPGCHAELVSASG